MRLLTSVTTAALMCCSSYAVSNAASDSSYIVSDIPNIKNEIKPNTIRSFLGRDITGNFAVDNQSLFAAVQQLTQDMFSQDTRRLGAGYTLYQGCKFDDCGNKAGLVLDDKKQLQAIVLYTLNWIPARKDDHSHSCVYSRHHEYKACHKKRHKFTLYIPEKNLSSSVFEGIKQWGIDLDSDAAVEVIKVPL